MSAVLRGLACPINITPTCLTVDVGARGTENAGRLILGVITRDGGGIVCGDSGLELDECAVKSAQFGRKFVEVFATPISFTTGLRP